LTRAQSDWRQFSSGGVTPTQAKESPVVSLLFRGAEQALLCHFLTPQDESKRKKKKQFA